MATTSFDKNFKVTDEQSIEKFKNAAANPRKITVKQKNDAADKSKGIQLLAQQLLNLGT